MAELDRIRTAEELKPPSFNRLIEEEESEDEADTHRCGAVLNFLLSVTERFHDGYGTPAAQIFACVPRRRVIHSRLSLACRLPAIRPF